MSLPKEHVTFEDYFKHEISEGKTEFRVVAQSTDEGVKLYIHPLGKNGESRDFIVTCGDTIDVTRWLPVVSE